MASFTRLEIWTDVACASGAARVAVLDPVHLEAATLTTSLTGTEALKFVTSRTLTQADEIVHARVVRVCWSDTALDTEWRISEIVDQSGTGDRGQRAVTAQALALDLARAPWYTFDSAGRPRFDFSATQLTATDWLGYVVDACTAAPLPYTVSVGTVEFTNPFDLDGDFATALELVRAIQQPGRAPGDFVFRRHGTTDYQLDLLVSRGSTAAAVPVEARKNLLEHVRTRSLATLGTQIVPRGMQGCATRDLSQTYWKVKAVPSGTTAELEDPYGGDGPVGFDDQLNGTYVARLASTFSSQQVTDSSAASQTITVASTTGWATGDFVRFFTTTGASGKRLVSLAHPTAVLAPTAGGYGPVTRILDMSAGMGDANLLTSNAWLNTWTTSGSAPDGWSRSSSLSGTWTRDTSVLKIGTYAQKIAVGTTAGKTETTKFYSPTATPYTTSGLRYAASAWYYCDSVSAALQRYVRLRIMKPDLSVSYADGDYLDPAECVGQWVKISIANADLSAATSGVVVLLEIYVNNDPIDYAYHTSYFGPMTLSESDTPIEDVLYNGGIAMWQRANTLLATIAEPMAGYTLRVTDLARIDDSDWADEVLTLGGTVAIRDTTLGVTTAQRVTEMTQNLLQPLDTAIQLATIAPTLTSALTGLGNGSTITGAPSTAVVAAPAAKRSTLADYGITDAYTRTEIDNALNALVLNDVPANSYTNALGLRSAMGYGYAGATWTSRTSGFGSEDIRGACYGNGYFVIVGTNGTLATSTDGATWTTRTSGFGSTQINAVAYGNGLFVAVGNNGVLTTASDPTGTWTARTSNAIWGDPGDPEASGPADLQAVCYGNGTYVAVANHGVIISSTNGTTWTRRASVGGSSTDVFTSVAYGLGTFVAGFYGVGGGAGYGSVYTATAGVSWTLQDISFGPTWLTALSFRRGQFVGGANDGRSLCSFTGTGNGWTGYDTGIVSSDRTLAAIAIGDDRVMVIGTAGQAFYSFDGVQWMPLRTGLATSCTTRALAYGANTFVLGGSGGQLISLTIAV